MCYTAMPHVYIYIYTHVYMYIHICICICVYIYIHIHGRLATLSFLLCVAFVARCLLYIVVAPCVCSWLLVCVIIRTIISIIGTVIGCSITSTLSNISLVLLIQILCLILVLPLWALEFHPFKSRLRSSQTL